MLSVAAHALLLGVVRPSVRAAPARPPAVEAADRWAGTTAELPSSRGLEGPLVDVAVEAAPPPAPPPAAGAPSPPRTSAPASPAPGHDGAVAAPAPRPRSEGPRRPASPRAEPSPRSVHRPLKSPSSGPAGGEGAQRGPGAPGGGAFGADGPASVRDLGRAFTRAIPPACSADPVWATLPSGDVGRLEVEVRVDATGHLASAEPRGASPPRALVNVLRRTVPMLEAGTFALREGATTEGVEILELSARIGEPESGGEPAPDQLAFEYARGKGKARFAQPGGRHVEVAVRVVKVVVR